MGLIILDRDGVINHDSDNYIRTVAQWVAIEGSIQAIADLSQAGYRIAIATNQSGIGRGYYSLATLSAMHQKMTDLVSAAGGSIAQLVFCPHLPSEHCACRKPEPGMLLQILAAQQKSNTIDAHQTWFIGDSLRDLQAAWAIDMQTALVKTGKGQRTLDKGVIPAATPVFADLAAFSQHLLSV
ncbi:MAG: d,D-heptose 1,7-bisphosphate phosphatase [Osedax symbiont Rs1]|nr:MAG: d,D-heptose 1,7-bisphosphate phosphatase [Osedax symbiont Rs1]